MYASFLQLMESCQEESVDNFIFIKNDFIKYYQYIEQHGKLFIHVKVLNSVKIDNYTLKNKP